MLKEMETLELTSQKLKEFEIKISLFYFKKYYKEHNTPDVQVEALADLITTRILDDKQ